MKYSIPNLVHKGDLSGRTLKQEFSQIIAWFQGFPRRQNLNEGFCKEHTPLLSKVEMKGPEINPTPIPMLPLAIGWRLTYKEG